MQVKQKRSLDKDWIDREAHKIVDNLQRAGFTTYLVGGCVRDLLLGLQPKDFDIATLASPREVKRRISKAYIIGKRFRLVLIQRHETQFEVATFRRDPSPEELEDIEAPFGDNIFGQPEDDANRRDFTVNALFYDPITTEIIDYINGLHDIEMGILKMIGEPTKRILEDPIRILRAIRLSHKIQFQIEPELRNSIQENAQALEKSVLPRKREDLLKILKLPHPYPALLEAHDLGVLKVCFPTLDQIFQDPQKLDRFDCYFYQLRDMLIDEEQPADYFLALFYAWSMAMFDGDREAIKNYWCYETNSELRSTLRDEMGMYNAEQEAIIKTFELMELLIDQEAYLRKGGRRKAAILKQSQFLHALNLLDLERMISPQETKLWYQEYYENYDKLVKQSKKNHPRPYNRRRKKNQNQKQ